MADFSNVKVFSHQPKLGFKGTQVPNLLQFQLDSFKQFLSQDLKNIFEEIFPIHDYTGKDLELSFLDYSWDEPKIDEETAKTKNLNYEASLRVNLRLSNKKTGDKREQEVYFGDFPIMTPRGTFVINGIERVIITQLIRSPGVYFTSSYYKGRQLFGAKLIPYHGAWLELETGADNSIGVKIDRKRKAPVSALLRVFGLETDDEIRNAFLKVDIDEDRKYIEATLKKDPAKSKDDGFVEIFKRIRPGDRATIDNAKGLVDAMFNRLDRYDLAKVGRYKLNQRLNFDDKIDQRTLRLEDLVSIVSHIIELNNNVNSQPDDVDHLGNRRLRATGELLAERMRLGMLRIKRIIQDRMSTYDITSITPAQLINPRPLMSTVREFFTTSQMSQFMGQVNPLDELEHKRKISSLGPGGLTRERAGFEVRDVHVSHYGRICPIQSPEGQNIGLVTSLAIFGKLNELGFIETPYIKVKNAHLTQEVVWLDAYEEEKFKIAHGGVLYDQSGKIINKIVEVRLNGNPGFCPVEEVDYIDVSPQQILSLAASLIPFLEHDDVKRALMASNMQRQAVPCLVPDLPMVGTGLEDKAAFDSGQLIIADEDGEIIEIDGDSIKIKCPTQIRTYTLKKFVRTNQNTCISQKPIVIKGQKVKKGEVLADSSATKQGKIALGQNLLVAFIPWGGANFEGAVILSERLVKENYFASIHLEEFSCEVRETKLGPESTTRDIPNVSDEKLKDLDEEGIVRIGAEVKADNILVGKVSPKGEVDLTPEEKLLRAIFGEEAKDVKDTSLMLKHGRQGKVIRTKVLTREKDKLDVGVIKYISVEVAELRKILVGDKLTGRHGNKGVVSKIMPEEDMPYLEDGTPVDIILDPLSIASRMNLGQILETHLGWAAAKQGYRAISPPFDGATEKEIKEELKKAGLPESGKVKLYDGRNGLPFDREVTVGITNMMKLDHMVADKVHMRAIGPYSLITQQPLGGKAQFGGQRFGEMEVWALEGYGASYTLQEMLTIKSDDVLGRAATYESIIRGETIKSPNIPAAFNVILSELKSLGMSVEMVGLKTENKVVEELKN